eukprot:TRINITY_DN24505_c0_g1_i5.p1 TRINITY_DN24505_c0_g1~~TRINITY_DN24505_c0_g1_i5.p1  ORF type:complete len:255 (-),score=-4.64 TRINITY_DN24505_c0_g1_i5:2-766(-)
MRRNSRESEWKGPRFPFQCEYCDKCFTSADKLRVHRKIHTLKKSFSCKVCTKSFTYKMVLEAHEKIHTASIPFACKICHKIFKSKGNLQDHELVHSLDSLALTKSDKKLDNSTSDKPFSCEHCQKSFRYKQVLQFHLNICPLNRRNVTLTKPQEPQDINPLSEENSIMNSSSQIFSFKPSFTLNETNYSSINEREIDFSCTDRNKSFAKNSNLVGHKLNYYDREIIISETMASNESQTTELLESELAEEDEKND